MNPALTAVLLLAAFVCFVFAAVGVAPVVGHRGINLVAVGLACWVLTLLVPALKAA